MAIAAGTRLGPYEITTQLGSGGMGEVYRARDTRLERTVAIKILPAHLSSDAARKQRFEREAKIISGMNHPHICVLHDVGCQDGIHFLVMECLEGETLAHRLEKGALPLDHALKYGAQIADALDRAHRSGIIHRDLKPANIMLTPSGAKLLDFGLAKPAVALSGATTLTSPASSSPVTEQGTIIGTFQYMSPEQIEAKELDGRSDIFSLGALLYEMLTGHRAFQGKSQLSIASAILEKEPAPVSTFKPLTPSTLNHAIRRCLAKDPEQRWQTARDLHLELTWIAENLSSGSAPDSAHGTKSNRDRIAWTAAGIFALIAAAALWFAWSRPEPAAHPLHFKIEPPPGADFLLESAGGSAISPDGHNLVFVAISGRRTKLWLRPLDSTAARELPGTENAQYPFWSPDSQSVGFFANGKLQRIDLLGGPPVTLAEAPNPRGAAWSSRGVVVFAPTAVSSIWRVPANGGTAKPITMLNEPQAEFTHRWPVFLPDGNRFVYLSRGEGTGIGSIYLSSLDRPQDRTILVKESSTNASYSPAHGSHPELLYWGRQQALVAQAFDSSHARLTGEVIPVPGAESAAFNGALARSSVSVSNDGTVLIGTGSDRYQLSWLDRQGNVVSTLGQPDRYGSVRISPDGLRVAGVLADSFSRSDLWLLELARAIPSRLTFIGGIFGTGVWSPDSQQIAFHLLSGRRILVRSASGAGQEETILHSQHTVYLNDWSADGRFLLYTQQTAEGRSELWLLPLQGDRRPEPFLKNEFNEFQGQVSPDNRWVAYCSDESGGVNEVYVTSFPAAGPRWRVSNGGGSYVRWSRNGKELFYRSLDGTLMVASVQASKHGLEFSTPAPLFRVWYPAGMFAYPYDVAPDGQRILALMPSKAAEDNPSLNVLINWDSKTKP
jgi:serine/threonine protein kinase/Tol biopolymer transport system component